jgi:hypothetical protein
VVAAPAAVAVAPAEREPTERVAAAAVPPVERFAAPAAPAAPPSARAEMAAAPATAASADAPAGPSFEDDAPRITCTQAQLRRFIKSRPWIPMHELRRRFGIAGGDDDVTPVRIGASTIFVGLPSAEGRLLGELLAGGEVGYELSLDPGAPIVVGVYPMRPVPRG